MRAFVTGGTGLLGNNLVRALLRNGHDVLALSRTRAKANRELGDTQAHIVIGDMADVSGFADALSNVDVVFHTAAFFRDYYQPGDHHSVLDRVNVKGTMELARAAEARGVQKMVDTSSAGLIGLNPDGSAGDEGTPPWSGTSRNLYLQSKQRVAPLLRAFSAERSFFIASVLPAWMWGPHDAGPTASGQLVLDALKGSLPAAIPPGGSSVVDARDVASGMLRVAEVGRSGEQYILSSRYVDLAELIGLLAAATGQPAPNGRIPYSLAWILASLAEGWSRVSGRPSSMSSEAVQLMNARLAVSAAKAERELGASFRPFADTIAETVAWLRTRLRDKPRSTRILASESTGWLPSEQTLRDDSS
jgi:dihydroflavonol-4-reductase